MRITPKKTFSTTLPSYTDWPKIKSRIRKDPAVESRIKAIIATMSLNEKIGQITQAEVQSITADEARQYYIGSVFSHPESWPGGDKHASPSDWLKLADGYWTASMSTDARVKIPIMWGIDAIHGSGSIFGATLFPHNIGLGATRDPRLIRRIGAATAKQLRVVGHDWTFAPTLAVVRDDRWGRTYEGYAEHPSVTRAYAQTMIEGLQDTRPSNTTSRHRLGRRGVIATAKHFIGDGGTDQGKDQGVNASSTMEMINIHGQGYFGALAAGVQAVMVSFSSWTNEALGIAVGKMHGSRLMLTDVLKQKIGFDGMVLSDSNGLGQVPGCSYFRCAQAINAGIDVFMVPTDWKRFISNTLDLVQRGEVPISRIDDAVARILRVKLRAGIFAKPKPSKRQYAGNAAQLVHRELAREVVQKSLVLLKNNNNVLPLARNQRVLVVGKNADSLPNQTGAWSLGWQGTTTSNADFPNGTTILSGIRQANGDANVAFSENADDIDIAQFDAVIAVIGETPYAEGIGDIGRHLTLEHCCRYPEDLAVLDKVSGKGVPVITVFVSGRPLYTNKELNRSDAFVAAWLPGTEGQGIADVLFRKPGGEINKDFHGKLSYSWPKTARQSPLNFGDSNYDPLFAYGFGLHYGITQKLPMLDEVSLPGTNEETASSDLATQDLEVFVRGNVPPYQLRIGSPAEWGRLVDDPLTGAIASSDNNISVQIVDVSSPGDGRQLIWTGCGAGQVFMQSLQPADLRGYLNANGALVFDIIVTQAPLGLVKVRIDCIWPCFGELDGTKLFRSMPLNIRQTVKIPLKYFAARGTDFSLVNTALLIYTEKAFVMSIANIRWMPGAAMHDDVVAYDNFFPSGQSR